MKDYKIIADESASGEEDVLFELINEDPFQNINNEDPNISKSSYHMFKWQVCC